MLTFFQRDNNRDKSFFQSTVFFLKLVMPMINPMIAPKMLINLTVIKYPVKSHPINENKHAERNEVITEGRMTRVVMPVPISPLKIWSFRILIAMMMKRMINMKPPSTTKVWKAISVSPPINLSSIPNAKVVSLSDRANNIIRALIRGK